MAKIKSPKIFDPYLGQMYGNILDQYDNPAYSIRLYMKAEENSTASTTSSDTQAESSTGAESGSGARSDQPSASTPKVTNPADKKIVILAQTGVTGVQIDDLEIETGNQKDQSGKALTGSFTIIQPGAANFLDQIQYAKKYLGATDEQLKSQDFYYYIDINFLGYDSDPDDNEAGGEPTQIVDTTTYKIRVTEIAVRLDNTGSRYDFKFSVADTIGFADEIYKIPKTISIEGSKISEFLKDLEAKYNASLSEMSTEFGFPDQIEFNLDALLKSTSTGLTTTGSSAASADLYIKDETIPTADKDQNVETTTIPIFSGEIKSRNEQRQAADGAQTSGLQTEKIKPGAVLTVNEGNSIYTVIAQVLSMNKEFQSYVSRKKTLDDPGNREVNDKQTFVAWFDVHCEIQNRAWDKKRNKYSKKYIYTPYIVQDVRSDVALTTAETAFLTETGDTLSKKDVPITAIATKRLQDLYNANCLHKSYFYVFTGLNDQIINLDINYDQAITMLMPPKGGFAGDYSLEAGASRKNTIPVNADPTGDDKDKAAKTAQNKESLLGLLNQIKGLGDSIKNVAESIGRSPEELAGILKDKTGASARRLVESLDSASVQNLTKKLGTSDSSDPTDTPTTNTEITVTSFGEYAPEVSGYLYAADFVQPGGSLTQEELQSAGLIPMNVPTDVPPATATSKSVPSPLSGITSDGPASVLMGYVYRSREGSGFMLQIEMTIRGDPYWLSSKNSGKFEYGKPTPDKTTNPPAKNKYYFLLTIGSPSRYDYDINDEDNNSGYWSDGRTSGVFSGLYYPTIWKHRFSGGIFTTEITASKEIAVPLQWIRRVKPGETPPPLDQILKDAKAEEVLKEVGLSNEKIVSNTNAGPGGDSEIDETPGPAGSNGRLDESQLVSVTGGGKLSAPAAAAYEKMVAAAKADGINWSVTDSYRTFEQQVALAKEKGIYSEGGLAARPGTSNHGWGTALDLGGGVQNNGSPQNNWLRQNAARFGFRTIPREPWHWEYKP